ncbi:leukocyte immunoglobulin-like receptor subfamily B member 3 isoform X3 [Saccopteryx bilineata]|uniref:leukocyte immunoglobulin-like receptor subfamily B member 3 isoform X3 n=1 Tax=Saccopteryx bilineata TaxID=59482 RepID=UPI0033903537
MGGSSVTPTLTALLCLGLCWCPWDQVQAGLLPKPSIWADPGPRVTKGSPVTIWCQGSLQANAYSLYRERGFYPWENSVPPNPSNKTSFLIKSTSSYHAGLYQCAYSTGSILSEPSEPLFLVVTGVYAAPSLSAQPSPVVASGGHVSLSCGSQNTWGTFHLLKERGADPPRHVDSGLHAGRWQAVFPVGPVSTSHAGTYRCYVSPSSYPYVWSQPSDPLHIQVTGVHSKPSLSAQPCSLVRLEDSLMLECHSESGFDRFALTKDEGITPPQRLDGQHSPIFLLGHVNQDHRGQYRCYSGHSLSYVWSAPSAPLDILITGMYIKPSLSAQPGPSVPWGGNVTLQCGSEVWFDTFHLHREGSRDPPQHLRLQDRSAPSQATFTISAVTSGHNGTYRCYGSHSTSPYLLSLPSDPLELVVSGSPEDWSPTMHKGLKWYQIILIGVLVALIMLLSLLLFLLLRHQRRSKGRTSVAAASGHEDRGLQNSSSPCADVQDEGLYAVMTDTQPEEDRQVDSQAGTSDAPQDVTYAQLNHLALRRETTAPPSSLSEDPSDESSVYAALAVH